jgi:hypothetical protein
VDHIRAVRKQNLLIHAVGRLPRTDGAHKAFSETAIRREQRNQDPLPTHCRQQTPARNGQSPDREPATLTELTKIDKSDLSLQFIVSQVHSEGVTKTDKSDLSLHALSGHPVVLTRTSGKATPLSDHDLANLHYQTLTLARSLLSHKGGVWTFMSFSLGQRTMTIAMGVQNE